MPQLQIQFNQPLTSVSSNDCVIQVLPSGAINDDPNSQNSLVLTLQTLLDKTTQLQSAIADGRSQLKNTAAAYAIDIVRNIMQKDDAMITARLQSYVDVAFENVGAAEGCNLFVNPQTLPQLKAFVNSKIAELKNESNIEIELTSDDALVPGDCRIEFGDTGLIASLDSQLELIGGRLNRAIAAGEVA